MKTKIIFIFLISLTFTLFSQNGNKESLFSIGDYNLGGYVGVNGKHTTYESKGAGFVDLRAAVIFESGWGIGLDASGLYYDKKLSTLVSDGTYHIEAGYVGIFIEKMFELSEDFNFSISYLMANGVAKYTYDKEYRQSKLWYEETIDQTTFFVSEPSMEIQHRVFGNWWIGLSGSYRMTSPIKMIGTSESFLNKFNGGITIKYGIM
jgi:hypothetical protein